MPDTRLLLWTDNADAYLDAVGAAGLADRVTTEVLARKETPTQAQRADTEAMLAWGAPPRTVAANAEVALGTGADRRRGGLACPARSTAGPHAHLRARHPPRSMAENILGALFYLTKPYAAIVEDQRHSRWVRRVATPLAGQTLGIPGARRGRPAGRTDRIDDRHAGDRDPDADPTDCPRCCGGASVGANQTRSWLSRFCPAAAAGDRGDRELHECAAPGPDEVDRVVAELRWAT